MSLSVVLWRFQRFEPHVDQETQQEVWEEEVEKFRAGLGCKTMSVRVFDWDICNKNLSNIITFPEAEAAVKFPLLMKSWLADNHQLQFI